MSIFLKKVNSEPAGPDSPDRLHFIPAKLSRDSPADVHSYFDRFTEEATKNSEILRNSLRGRPLTGQQMVVPATFQGVVYTERKRPLNDDTDRVFQSRTTFDQFTYWNYDKNPTRNDAFAQALQWLEISDVLHAPEEPVIDK